MNSSLKPHLFHEVLAKIEAILNRDYDPRFMDALERRNVLLYIPNFLLAGKETFSILKNSVSSTFFAKYRFGKCTIHYKPKPDELIDDCRELHTEPFITSLFLRFVTHIWIDTTIYSKRNKYASHLFQNQNIEILNLDLDHHGQTQVIANCWKKVHSLKCHVSFYETLNDSHFENVAAVTLYGSLDNFKEVFMQPNLRQLPAKVEIDFTYATYSKIYAEIKMASSQPRVKHLNLDHQKCRGVLNPKIMKSIATFVNNFDNLESCIWSDNSKFFTRKEISVELIKKTVDVFLQAPFKPNYSVEMVIFDTRYLEHLEVFEYFYDADEWKESKNTEITVDDMSNVKLTTRMPGRRPALG